jgi:glycosyltransferase involved in cell wall biosynthesis
MLVTSAGSARNVLAAAEALSRWADVTIAFRNVAETVGPTPYRIVEIDPARGEGRRAAARSSGIAVRDDVAARGLNPFSHSSYLARLRNFAAAAATEYDLVFEKGWRLSGYLAREFMRYGVPAVLIENDARAWNEPVKSLRTAFKYVAHASAQAVAGFCSRRLPLVIAETEQLKEALVARRGLRAERIEVVQLGVNHALFRPLEQAAARASLGIAQDALIVLYVGGLDPYHDLSPLLGALRRTAARGLELHIVGDGEYRSLYQTLARDTVVPVTFHGKVEHGRVPLHIAAADVCVAPYRTSGFFKGEVSFSTLKIPEYMACARPVISVPSGHILDLVEDGVTGFLFSNEIDRWLEFLDRLPSRGALAEMGRAAAPRVANVTWETTAKAYLDCSRRDIRARA